jgi:hypothetical protein
MLASGGAFEPAQNFYSMRNEVRRAVTYLRR